MAIPIVLPLRVVQTVFAIIILGLTAYVASWWNGYWHDSSPSEINFLIFAATWSILALVQLSVVQWKFSGSGMLKLSALVVEGLTMLFWFAGFIALAVFLSNRVCFGQVCNVAKAAVVFASLEWLAFAITFVFTVLDFLRNRGSSSFRGNTQSEVTQKPRV